MEVLILKEIEARYCAAIAGAERIDGRAWIWPARPQSCSSKGIIAESLRLSSVKLEITAKAASSRLFLTILAASLFGEAPIQTRIAIWRCTVSVQNSEYALAAARRSASTANHSAVIALARSVAPVSAINFDISDQPSNSRLSDVGGRPGDGALPVVILAPIANRVLALPTLGVIGVQ
jgi:hypothetical protein